jgi:hypothetical protein
VPHLVVTVLSPGVNPFDLWIPCEIEPACPHEPPRAMVEAWVPPLYAGPGWCPSVAGRSLSRRRAIEVDLPCPSHRCPWR